MTDIAQLGFKVDTTDLDKAKISLNKLQAAASGVSSTAGSISTSVARTAYQVAKANREAAAAALALANTTKTATKEQIVQAREAVKVAKAEELKTKAMYSAARAANSLEKAQRGLNTTSVAVAKRSTSAAQVLQASAGANSTAPLGVANDQLPNRFNTANVAAQFQDIGVTASMGMNPLTIAIQQGTQLSAIISSMENPLKGIGIALRQIISPVALLSIGLVALVAAGIQMVDWTGVARSGLNLLADGMDVVANNFEGLAISVGIAGATLLLFNAGAIVSSIYYLGVLGASALAAGAKMAAAWVIANAPVAILLASFALITASLTVFSKAIDDTFGIDIVNSAKTAVNKIIGFFVGAFKVIIEGWKNVGRQMRGEAKIDLGDVFSKSLNTDYIGDAANTAKKAIKDAALNLRVYAQGLGAEDSDKKKGKSEKSQIELYQELVAETQLSIQALKDEGTALGMNAREAAVFRAETELLNAARAKGINLTPQQITDLKALALETVNLTDKNKTLSDSIDFAKDVGRSFFTDIASGLKNGKSIWESFSNAVVNSLNKILDKMLDKGFEQFFDGFGQTGTGGNILSSIGQFLFSAKGNAFDNNGVQAFAKGGTFTNGVYSKPTMFQFGQGGSFGVMGEAGAEAVMPLQRGSDGSLGVRVSGAANNNAGGLPVVVNVNNYGNAKASVTQTQNSRGVQIDVLIDEAVSKKISEQGTSTNRALNTYNSRELKRR